MSANEHQVGLHVAIAKVLPFSARINAPLFRFATSGGYVRSAQNPITRKLAAVT
jgi:hypothetical protein